MQNSKSQCKIKNYNNLTGFTLAEVLIAMAIFVGGIVFVLRSFVTLLSVTSFSQNMTTACFFTEEKIWEIEQNYKQKINAETSGKQEIGAKEYKWNYTQEITDFSASLEQLNFEISWQERPKENEYSMKFLTYLPMMKK